MVGLFVLSALVPLCMCAAFLVRELGGELNRTQQRNLDGVVRGFGMTVLGRLGSADDVLGVIVSEQGATDGAVTRDVSRLDWVRSVRSVPLADRPRLSGQNMPVPNARQQQVLASKAPVLLCGSEEDGDPPVFLLRELPSGAWLYVEVSSKWLWSDANDYAAGSGLLVLDDRGRRIATAGPLPGRIQGDLQTATWEMFLGSRFSSPSWRIVSVRPRHTLLSGGSNYTVFFFGFILLTILLVAWLSMTAIRRQLQPLAVLTQATKRIAQRDFATFTDIAWKDEFGDLARAFGTMSGQLRMQFSTLETLSEIDRLLLRTPELEPILDTLLPRIAAVMPCDSVSVLLFDPDSDGHARAYDYYAAHSGQLPVRRIAADFAALKTALERTESPLLRAGKACEGPYLAPMSGHGIRAVQLQPLKRGSRCAGALCIGYAREEEDPVGSGLGVVDFADRLSLILASLEQSEALHRQAHFDPLTGLQNRSMFCAQLLKAVAAAQETETLGGLLYIDLDQFKQVNDTAGHGAGDSLLRIVGERLSASGADGRAFARLGGDEFAVLLPRIQTPDSARQVAANIIGALQEPILIDGRQHRISASIGIAVFPSDGTTVEQLLRSGDIAMYQAKEAGRGRAVFFEAEMQKTLLQRVALEDALHHALRRGEFILHYQPIVPDAVSDGLAMEALIRWPGSAPGGGLSPAAFIPITEENDQIIQLGDWILRTACEEFARWRSAGLGIKHISVNVSVRQLIQADFLSRLVTILAQSGMQGRELQLEITESVLAQGEQLQQTLAGVVAQGVRVALDDFGTGYSSLSYLRRFPIHSVKIDRSFVQELPHDTTACRLAQSIVAMCHALGKEVVAEGVETEAQRNFLRLAGCAAIQGYLVGRPMAAADIPDYVRRAHLLGGSAAAESPTALKPESGSASFNRLGCNSPARSSTA